MLHLRVDNTITKDGDKPFYYDKDVRTNAILYINTLLTYVNREQLPDEYGSDYDYNQEIDGMDDLREWAKTSLDSFSLDETNWNRRAETGEIKRSNL